MFQVLFTPMVWAISREAAVAFSTTSRLPEPVNRIRYRFPFCSPAIVYSLRMIWSSVLVPGKSWLILIPVAASEAVGIPKSPQI